MAIFYAPAGGGAANVPDATTTVKGIVRLATIQEAQGNFQDIAVTPAGVQQAIAGIVGGMTFKGSYDVALATPALENAEQGDYYVVSNVKVNPSDTNTTYDRFGQEWGVGDHLVIKEDMGGTIDDAKILKVDNTEKVAYLNDLLDVTEALAAQGHVLIHDGTDYKNRALTTADIVGLAQHLYALLDVSLGELSSAVYTTATTSLSLVHSRDYTIDIQGLDESQQPAVPFVKAMVLPSSLNDDHDEIRVVNLGDGELEFQVTGSAVFHVAGNQSTTPISVTTNSEIVLVGEVRTYTEPDPQDPQQTIEVNKVAWELTTSAIPSRQSLVREGSGDWTNGFLTAADIVGVVSQGQLETLQNEVDRTQDSAGLNNDGSMAVFGGNYINGNTTLRQAITTLDSSLKSEETARISGDSSLQSQLNSEISARQGGDSNLQTQINNLATIATTGASVDASVAHTAVAYTPSAANVEAHITEIDATLNSVLSTNVLSVNSETPTLGDVSLDGTHIDTTTTANNYTAAGASLDEHLDGIDTKLGSLQADLSTEVSDRTSGDANLQSQITALATVASTGAAADVSVAHTATSYTPTGADVEAHIVGLDTQVNLLGSQIVTSVNAEAPVNGDVTLDGTHIDTLTTANNYTVAGASLDEHLDGIDNKIGGHQVELDTIETGAGLNADGTYSANGSANYINAATSLKVADNALDTQIKATQDELDVTQTGAGLDASGTYTANAGTNYLGSASSLKSADELLDAAIATLSSSTVVTVNGEAPDVNGDVNVDGSEIDTLTTANNYTVAGASLDEHLDGIDTELGSIKTGAGLQGDGTYLANAGANYIASATSLKNADNKLDTALDGVNTRLTTVEDSAVYTITSGATTLSVTGGSNDLLMDADDIKSTVTAVNYTGAATDSVATQITNIDTALLRPTVTVGYQATSSDPLNTHLTNIDSAIALKAPIDSPTFTTAADAPTPTAGDNSTSVATTAFVQTEIANISTTSQGANGTVQTSDGASGFAGSNWKFDPTSGHLLPDTNDTYDIGSATQKVRDMYLGSNSLKLVDDAGTPNVISLGLTDAANAHGENHLAVTGSGTNGVVAICSDAVDDQSNPIVTDPMLALVASTGKYTDLVDAPQSVIASSSFDTVTQTYQLEAGNHHTYFPPSGDTFVLVVPDSVAGASGGDAIRITNWGNGQLKITTSGSSANTWLQYSQTLSQAQTGGGAQPEIIIESRTTVDLYGWSYSSGGTTYAPAWGVYFSPSMEINTKSLTTSGEMLVYDATNDELVAGGLGDLSLTYAPTNYDNTLGSTVTGDKVAEHLEGIDNKFADISIVELNEVNSSAAVVPAGTMLLNDGSDYKPVLHNLDSLTDVDTSTTAPVANDRLAFDGTNFVPAGMTTTTTVTSGLPNLGAIDHVGVHFVKVDSANVISLGGFTSVPDGSFLIYDHVSGSATHDFTGIGNSGIYPRAGGNPGPIDLPPNSRRMFFVESGAMWELYPSDVNSLDDVTVSNPQNGEALLYDSTSGKWENGTVNTTVANLDDIGDVDLTTTAPTSGEFLKYDGTNWVSDTVPVTAYAESFSSSSTATAPSVPSVGTVLLYSATGGTGTLTLYTPSTANVGTQLTITNHSTDTTWSVDNGAGAIFVDGANTNPVTLAPSQSITLTNTTGSLWYVSALEEGPLGSLIDVDLTTTAPTNGDFLKFDGTNWVPDVASATVASLDDIGDVDLTTAAPSNGDTLEWNGTNWVPVAPSGGGTGVAPSVTVQSPTANITLSAPSSGVVEEAYIYTPSQAITVNLATASSGFKYQIKNRSTHTMTIDAGAGVTIDASQTFTLSVQESAVTLITDGSNWFII